MVYLSFNSFNELTPGVVDLFYSSSGLYFIEFYLNIYYLSSSAWCRLYLLFFLQFLQVRNYFVYMSFSQFSEGCLYCDVFPSQDCFCCTQRFGTVVSSFSIVSTDLFNSSLTSWLTLSSFSRMLFNLHVFEFLPNFFL